MHMIDMTTGRAAMAYVGAVPWHGLGSQLTEDATIEVWQTEAGMNYRVCRSRVRFGTDQIWDKRHVLFRSDTKAPLGIVSDGYHIVQPGEVLEFFRDLCAANQFKLETAGVLFDGARYWALARTPNGFVLPGDDLIGGYVMLVTSADGSLATTAKHVAMRAVCWNTLQVALGESKRAAIKVRHSTRFDGNSVKADMGLLTNELEQFAGKCERLASTRLSTRQALDVLVAAMGDPEKLQNDLGAGKSVREAFEEQPNKRAMAQIVSLYANPREMIGGDKGAGTAWSLVNAATEHYDHHAGRSDNTRLASAWFGPASTVKQAIFEKALLTTVVETGGSLLDNILAQGSA